MRCLWYPLPHLWVGLVIIRVIHVCFLLFLSSWALQTLASRNSLFHALLLRGCLYIVALVYNPLFLPLFLVNFLFLVAAGPSPSERLLCKLLSDVSYGGSHSFFFHCFRISYVYPMVLECVSCVHPKNKVCVSRVDVDTHYPHLCSQAFLWAFHIP